MIERQIDSAPSIDLSHGDLRVSDNGRFLIHADGTPFFWLGDTAWELFHRLTREEILFYLENRRRKRFSVIQTVLLAEFGGLEIPNAYGDLPLIDFDPTRLNEGYFRHVDWVIATAAEKGMYVGVLPTWGNKVIAAPWEKSQPRIIFNESNARRYGNLLGERYRNALNMVWILGGDRAPQGAEAIWRAMAQGLDEGDGGRHLKTFHPPGVGTSSALHREAWLDFNMIQSGHRAKDFANFGLVAHDYSLAPVKPVIDGEPRYEDHPVNWEPQKLGWFDDYDVRQAAYWALLAGACGHTYGCHSVWQMLTPERDPIGFARGDWRDALDLPGAAQMRHVRDLFESRDFLSLRPDQSLVIENPAEGWEHAQAARGNGFASIYLPGGKPVLVRTGDLPGQIEASWFNPRTGEMRSTQADMGEVTAFRAPGPNERGNDWVLMLGWS